MIEQAFVKNAADPGQVRAGVRKEKSRDERELRDLAYVLSSPAGLRLCWRILGYCELLRDPDRGDTHQTYRVIGQQNVGRWLLAQIERADKNAWNKMREEAEKEDRNG